MEQEGTLLEKPVNIRKIASSHQAGTRNDSMILEIEIMDGDSSLLRHPTDSLRMTNYF
ncbi:MAG: hypothetical protein NT092_10105 [Bacteroidia bacterium]|nr:hypothetical protein [Bacteroidia bacterium]